jgi:hypothetical protein
MPTAAPTLLELQRLIRRAVLDGDFGEIAAAIDRNGIDPAARLGIYRNHALTTLGAALRAAYPAVCRLVDERFFAYATHEYLHLHPPRSRCLVEYGADFPDFLAGFEACKALPYLADIARFEWALHKAAMVRETPPLEIDALRIVPEDRAGYIAFRLQPSVRYCSSLWPIDEIWQANQQQEVPLIELANRGACVEVRRRGETVVWQRLDPGSFAFREALAGGFALAAAITSAMQREPRFDATGSLHQVFAEGLVVDFDVLSEEDATR